MVVHKQSDRILNAVSKNMQIMKKRMDKTYYDHYFGVIFSTLFHMETEKGKNNAR